MRRVMSKRQTAFVTLVCFIATFVTMATFKGQLFTDYFRVRLTGVQERMQQNRFTTIGITARRMTSFLANTARTTIMSTATVRAPSLNGPSMRTTTGATTFPTILPSLLQTSPVLPLSLVYSSKALKYVRTLKPPRKPFLLNGAWQSVRGPAKIYLYSAFYDDRAGVEKAKVRLIAIAESSVHDNSGQYCLFWYSKSTVPRLSSASLLEISAPFAPKIDGIPRSHRAVLFTCLVEDVPLNVSLVTWTEEHLRRPNTLLPVQIPPRQRERIEFGHCMSVLYWKHDPYRLVEWIELHRMWGVEEISVYTSSISDQTRRVLDYYEKQGVVVVRPAPVAVNASTDDEHAILLNMSPVLNDCLYRNMYRYQNLVCTDVDEFIVPRAHANYSALISAMNAKNVKKPRSYMFTNVYYFSELGASAAEPSFLVTPRYLRHLKPSPPGYSVKSITDPRACACLQNHFCWHRTTATENANWHVSVPVEMGANQHYKPCHFDAYLHKPGTCKTMMNESFVDRTMLRFAQKLEKRTVPVLLELALIEEIK